MRKTFVARVVGALSAAVVFASALGAQIGHVVGAQKVSDTSGGFTAALDDEDQFGRSIVNLGDMDGDGVTDLLVGAHTDDDGGLDQGAVYVLFMHANGFVKAWQKISDLEGNFAEFLDPNDQFGRAAANLGDLDGDGVVDVAVSSNYDDDGGTNKGAVYILFLNANGTVKAVQKISTLQGGLPTGLHIHDEFGRSITALGDLDGDGLSDILVGTPEDDESGTNTGALHVLFLNANGTVKAYRRISKFTESLAIKPGDWFGFSSTNLGDLDGDGVTDVAVGAVLDDDGGVNQGAVWILFLEPTGGVKEALEINELKGGFSAQLDDIDQFGTSVTSLGDLDGDGVTDIAVGAVKDDDGGQPGNPDADVGAVYVLFLNSDGSVKSHVKISDESGDLPYSLDQYDWFGSSLCRLGGSPGDGLLNVAIGCRNDDDGNPNRGAIYLVQMNDGTAPVADFVTSRTRGVAPLTVAFDDRSQNEVTSWVWSFGDGSQSSLRAPSKTYTVPGVYDIQLTVRGPRGRDAETKRGWITVSAGPLADFSADPSTGLVPLEVVFQDLSEGVVSSRWWDFGDGLGSSEASPRHVYGPGTFDVSLTVVGPNGSDTLLRPALVSAEDLRPIADFTPQPSTGFAPLTVSFDDRSAGLVTTWSWDFGDGTGSSEPEPTHVYAAIGDYPVSLTASGPHGTNTRTLASAVVVVSPVPSAAFELVPSLGSAPLRVEFHDRSSGDVTGWLWDFGDGNLSSEADPVHVYEDVGTFDVSLTVVGPQGSDAALVADAVTVSVPPPLAEFFSTTKSGFPPLTVEFTDQSSGEVTDWLWDFGDDLHSSAQNPGHVYTEPGSYTVTLTVTSPSGTDSEIKPHWIVLEDPAPVAEFAAAATSGPAPFAVQFEDRSQGLVTSWSWSFGDGGSSSDANPSHVYAAPGSYTVRLVATGPAGTDSEEKAGFVQVLWPAPLPEFGAGPVSGFAPLSVAFTDLTTGNATSWLWNFGDGSISRKRHPVKVYNRVGSFQVTLTATGPGGSRSIARPAISVVALPTFPDGGFEQQDAGAAPESPWTLSGGPDVLVVDASDTPETGFTSEGDRWLDIGSEGSFDATPAPAPRGGGPPPTGCVTVVQTIPFQPLAPFLTFDAVFLYGDVPPLPGRNDFMSVDVSDGTTSWNLYHADGNTPSVETSLRYGLPMTAQERVQTDLRALFPGVTAGTPLTLSFSVGNEGDGLAPSRGYVDAVHLVPAATAAFRNGTGRNASRYLSEPPILGGVWNVQVDVTGHARARTIRLAGHLRPASGLMRAPGELLVSGKMTFVQSWLAAPGINFRSVAVPLDLSLAGTPLATQVTILGGVTEYTNAFDLVFGF